MFRSSAKRARPALGLTVAGVLLVLNACTGSGGVPTSGSTGTSASAAPSVAASESTSTSGGGRGDYDYDYGAAATDAASPVPGPQAHQVNTGTGPLGTYLTGDRSLTLYTFKPDGPNTSACDGGCAQAWPTLTIEADDTLQAGDGVSGELTTFPRADGALQVAYNGAPLYYFATDSAPGDTNGQGIGDVWFVAKP